MPKATKASSDSRDIKQLAAQIGKQVDAAIPDGIGYFVVLHDFRAQNAQLQQLRDSDDFDPMSILFGDEDDTASPSLLKTQPTTGVATNLSKQIVLEGMDATEMELDSGVDELVRTGKAPKEVSAE